MRRSVALRYLLVAAVLCYLVVFPVHAQTQVFSAHTVSCNDPLLNVQAPSVYNCAGGAQNYVKIQPAGGLQTDGSVSYNISLSGVNLGGNSMYFGFQGFGGFTQCTGGACDSYLDFILRASSDACRLCGPSSEVPVVSMVYQFSHNGANPFTLSINSYDKDGSLIASASATPGLPANVDCLRIDVNSAQGVRAEYWGTNCTVDTTDTAWVSLPSSIQSTEQVVIAVSGANAGIGGYAQWGTGAGFGSFSIYTATPDTSGSSGGGLQGWLVGGARTLVSGIMGAAGASLDNVITNAAGGSAALVWAVLAGGLRGFGQVGFTNLGGLINVLSGGLGPLGNWVTAVTNLFTDYVGLIPANFAYIAGIGNNVWQPVIRLFDFPNQFIGKYVGLFLQVLTPALKFGFGFVAFAGIALTVAVDNWQIVMFLLVCDFAWGAEEMISNGVSGWDQWFTFNVKFFSYPFELLWWGAWTLMEIMRWAKQIIPLVG